MKTTEKTREEVTDEITDEITDETKDETTDETLGKENIVGSYDDRHGYRLARASVFGPDAPPPLTDRRLQLRLRQICDDYLEGATLALPRLVIEGAYWPRPSVSGLSDNSVGLVICANIERSSAGWSELFAEARRVLAPGGIFYLTAPDNLSLFDPHYYLPFLDKLPQWLAEAFLALTMRYDQPLYRTIGREEVFKLGRDFKVFDYTFREFPDTEKPPSGILEFCLIKPF